MKTYSVWTLRGPRAGLVALARGGCPNDALRAARGAGLLAPGEKACAVPQSRGSLADDALTALGQDVLAADQVKHFTREVAR